MEADIPGMAENNILRCVRMTRLILYIYETLKQHRLLRWSSLVVTTVVLVLLVMRQSYGEDISDFLPLSEQQQKAFQDYQNTSSARRIYVIFQAPDSLKQSAVDRFCDVLENHEDRLPDSGQNHEPVPMIPDEMMQEAMAAIYARMPYLLRPEDYVRIDSLLAQPDYISTQLEQAKQRLILPTAGAMTWQIQHDPLNLFLPVIERLKPTTSAHQTMLLIDSPYGASETEHNAQLVSMLQAVCDSVSRDFPALTIHLTGGPVIAVGNAQQIKRDSIAAISIAVVFILVLLALAFRSTVNLLLIALSIGWGWLFAMGLMTLVHHGVSIIVIGISSVIVGIAVNYPLHLIAHLSHTTSMRAALKEIVMPLVVGNVTTVGAFLALVPLDAVALRDLGLFSAFLLIGTIVFVLLWLPHMAKPAPKRHPGIFDRIGRLKLENHTELVWTVVVLTLFLGYFSLQTSFDADLRNINYMTDEQRSDMQQLEQVLSLTIRHTDLTQWNEWRSSQGLRLCQQIREASGQAGFAPESFDAFYHLVSNAPVAEGQTIASTIVTNLSANFNYIGWACSLIVFFFLWFSLGSIELALISFLPMAISWVWILGLMSLLGIQFNVVNIILATFIFGQGDDYTIFMTEGCQYEYAYRRNMLSSYKYSIIISALIMFIGIGALIVAKHPALFSLAEVTIIGMFSVVLMAYLFPPLIFRWLVYADGKERPRPITIMNMIRRRSDDTVRFVSDCYRYRGVEIISSVSRRLRRYQRQGVFQHIEEQLLPSTKNMVIVNSGWGEVVMYYALRMPDTHFVAIDKNPEQSSVARHVADRRVSNVSFVHEPDADAYLKAHLNAGVQTLLIEPSEAEIERYLYLNPIIIK